MNIVIKNIYGTEKQISSVLGSQTHERLILSPTPYPLGHIRRKF